MGVFRTRIDDAVRRIIVRLLRQGWSQREVAREVGVALVTVNRVSRQQTALDK